MGLVTVSVARITWGGSQPQIVGIFQFRKKKLLPPPILAASRIEEPVF